MIPKKLLKKLLADKRNKKCVNFKCQKKETELHHVWTFAGKQINEVWAIVGICANCHRLKNNGKPTKEAREASEYESIMRLIESGFENLDKYQKPLDQTWENRIRYYTKYYEANN